MFIYKIKLLINNIQKREIIYFKTTGNSSVCTYFNFVCHVNDTGISSFLSVAEMVRFVQIQAFLNT